MAPPRDDGRDEAEPADAAGAVVDPPAGPTLGQPAEAASAVAPLTDQPQDPAAVNPASPEPSESSPDGRPPEMPPGQCSECGASVKREKLEQGPSTAQRYHRQPATKHDLVGRLCGPVLTEWFYQVIATTRYFVPLPVPMNHPSAIVETENLLRAGMRPSSAVMTDWKLVGTK